ncbi:MAG: hypothetical protein ACFHX7_12595 [Pseudomonadota bacterium]
MMPRLRKWFGLPSADDDLVNLVRVAQEDAEIRRHLLLILEQQDFQRQSMINTWVEELRLAAAPSPLVRALQSLLDDDRAYKAHEILRAGLQ